jgi:L-amino acid N-acyltransferase YncA
VTGPTIREASSEDIPAITAIYAHHVLHGRASFEEVPPDATEIAHRHGAHIDKGLPYLVADVDGAVGHARPIASHARIRSMSART